MIKNILIVVMAIVFLQNDFHTQTVGYMGKKNSFDIGVIVVPSFTNWKLNYPDRIQDTTNNKVTYYSGVGIHVYPELNYSRTIGRNWDISIRLNYQTFKLYYAPLEVRLNDVSNGFYYTTSYADVVKSVQIEKSQSILTEINFRYNLKSYISPVGPYFNFGIGVYRSRLSSSKIMTVNFYDYSGGFFFKQSVFKNDWIKMARINVGFHTKKILTNYLYFDGGLDVSAVFTGRGKYWIDIYQVDESDLEDKYIPFQQYRYLFWENLLTLKLSIGYLF